MTPTLDTVLALAGILIAVSAGLGLYRRSEDLKQIYNGQIIGLREDYSKGMADAREDIRHLEKALELSNARIESLRLEYQKLATDYLRVIGENHWLRLQLRQKGIDIPPLPDDLRPHIDEKGNISIQISSGPGGIQVGGGSLDIKGDMVGGDETIGKDRTENKGK